MNWNHRYAHEKNACVTCVSTLSQALPAIVPHAGDIIQTLKNKFTSPTSKQDTQSEN